jgi:anti-anti-sigma factor
MAGVVEDGFPWGPVHAARDEAGVPVVRLVGEIDISNTEPIGDALDAIVGREARRVVVDVSGLDFMDSAGIAMLLRVAARVDAVEIRNPSVVMRRIIESTGLSGVFHITG